jgi:hypothetical protein
VLTCIKVGKIKGSKWKKNCMLNRKGENPNIYAIAPSIKNLTFRTGTVKRRRPPRL